MKSTLLLLIILFLLSGCSLMRKMMMKRMEKMSDEEKMEMMAKMMGDESTNTCSSMMEKMSGIHLDDSLPMADKASVMMPLCFEHILSTIEADSKAQFLMDITKSIILSGYDSLPTQDKPRFRLALIEIIEGME